MKQLLKFKAAWCGPCKSLSNIMEGVDFGVEIKDVDIDDDSETAIKYNIRGVPTLVLLDDGKEIKRISGVLRIDEIKSWLES